MFLFQLIKHHDDVDDKDNDDDCGNVDEERQPAEIMSLLCGDGGAS